MAPAPTTEFHLDKAGHPMSGSRWRHHSGRVYVILLIANLESNDPVKFPVTAVYQGENGRRWARPVEVFTGEDAKFTPEA